MEVYKILNGGDNFCYYVTMDKSKGGIFFDVWEPQKAQQFLQTMGITTPPHAVITTHKHYDHAGGNVQMKQMYPNIHIIGGVDDKVPGETMGVQDKQVVEVDGLKIMFYHTPCHTVGHICTYITPAAGE